MSISYAHNGEDIIIQEYIGDVKSFVDIGANDGVKYSNVYKFVCTGATGFSFEPIPSIFSKLQKTYKDYPVFCIQNAVSNKFDSVCMVDAGVLSHMIETADTGLTCRVIDTPEMPALNVWVDTIPAKEISYMWNQKFQHGSVPDLVSIDVEGHEHVILSDWPCDFLPKAFIIETHCYDKSDGVSWMHKHYNDILEKLVTQFGYNVVTTTNMNTLFVK